jgi:ABC-2 type transporter
LARLGVSVILAVVVGAVYGAQPSDLAATRVTDRVNIIAQSVINVSMLSMIKALQLFKRERSVVGRERAQDQYTAGEYLLAKSCAELPLDVIMAAAFGVVLHARSNLQSSLRDYIGLLSLLR